MHAPPSEGALNGEVSGLMNSGSDMESPRVRKRERIVSVPSIGLDATLLRGKFAREGSALIGQQLTTQKVVRLAQRAGRDVAMQKTVTACEKKVAS